MRIAYIISEKKNSILGDCLSSAKMFYVFDSSISTYIDLEIPKDIGSRQMAVLLSEFLRSKDIDVVVGTDIGPKAKSAIEDHGIRWYLALKDEDFESINNKLKTNKHE